MNRLSVWEKNSEEREGKGCERACRQTFKDAILPTGGGGGGGEGGALGYFFLDSKLAPLSKENFPEN